MIKFHFSKRIKNKNIEKQIVKTNQTFFEPEIHIITFFNDTGIMNSFDGKPAKRIICLRDQELFYEIYAKNGQHYRENGLPCIVFPKKQTKCEENFKNAFLKAGGKVLMVGPKKNSKTKKKIT